MDPGDGLDSLEIQAQAAGRPIEARQQVPMPDRQEEEPDGVFVLGSDVVPQRFVGLDLFGREVGLDRLPVLTPPFAPLDQVADGVAEFFTRCFGWCSAPLMASL